MVVAPVVVEEVANNKHRIDDPGAPARRRAAEKNHGAGPECLQPFERRRRALLAVAVVEAVEDEGVGLVETTVVFLGRSKDATGIGGIAGRVGRAPGAGRILVPILPTPRAPRTEDAQRRWPLRSARGTSEHDCARLGSKPSSRGHRAHARYRGAGIGRSGCQLTPRLHLAAPMAPTSRFCA